MLHQLINLLEKEIFLIPLFKLLMQKQRLQPNQKLPVNHSKSQHSKLIIRWKHLRTELVLKISTTTVMITIITIIAHIHTILLIQLITITTTNILLIRPHIIPITCQHIKIVIIVIHPIITIAIHIAPMIIPTVTILMTTHNLKLYQLLKYNNIVLNIILTITTKMTLD